MRKNGKRPGRAGKLHRMTKMDYRDILERKYAPTENPGGECFGFLNVCITHQPVLGNGPRACMIFSLSRVRSRLGAPFQPVTNSVLQEKVPGLRFCMRGASFPVAGVSWVRATT